MSWFRWRKRGEEAPAEAAAPEAPEREEPARQETAEAERKPARRRRGSRGGRGRKKKTETAAVAVEVEEKAAPAKRKPAPKKKQAATATKEKAREEPRRERKRPPARKPAAKPRAALPDVSKEILVSVEVLEQTVAVLEDGKVSEVYLGRPSHRSIAGNIYKGVVDNVLPGMEASFVDIGLERNGFLYVDEIVVPELEGKRHGKRIQELISRGQEVLVQAVKDPMGTKGARLTTEISLPGRFLVYTPYGDGIGVSRRLEDDERERLKAICKTLDLPEGGLDRPHGRGGRVRRGAHRRPQAPPEALVDDPRPRGPNQGSGARLPGGRAPPPDRPRPLHQRLQARRRRPRAHLPQDRRLPEAHLARAGGEGRALQGQAAAAREVGRPRGGQLDAFAQGRPAVGRLPRLRLRRGVHRDRREHRPLRRRPRQGRQRAGSRTRSRRTTSRP